jgi:long-chain acyl-CoA synthetase
VPTLTRQTTITAGTITEEFFRVADVHADRAALKGDGGRGQTYTYRDVAQLIERIAAGLQEKGYVSKPEIAVLSENRPEWGIAYLAIQNAGGTVVPIDANLTESEITGILRHSGVEVVFTSGRFEGLLERLGRLRRIVSFEKESVRSWKDLIASEVRPVRGSPNDVAALIYTSGTTGSPKAVVLTHRNILANLEGVRDAIQFDSGDLFLSILPLHHTLEATCGLLTPLLIGATVVYARSLKSRDILEDIGCNRISVVIGVPLLYEKMCHTIRRSISAAPLPRRLLFNVLYVLSAVGRRLGLRAGRRLFRGLRRKAGLDTVRIFVSGGAALPPSIAAFFNHIGFDLFQGYGMTECAPVISVNRMDDIIFGSVGPPLRNLEVEIHNPDANGIGEIIVRGESCTRGYWNNPLQTAELLRDGWLFTGDLGRIKGGHLWITGRKKNVIVSAAGKNIYPEEVEEKLAESPFILEAVVFGRKKENRQGEEVRAVIVPDMEQIRAEYSIDPNDPDLEVVRKIIGDEINRLKAEMAEYKRIDGFEVRLTELEKTSIKKVKRNVYG